MIINYRRIIFQKIKSTNAYSHDSVENDFYCKGTAVDGSLCFVIPLSFPSCALEDDLTHSCRLHNLWPFHLIEKENKLIGKTHNAQWSYEEPRDVHNRKEIK